MNKHIPSKYILNMHIRNKRITIRKKLVFMKRVTVAWDLDDFR
jgi:hypothetical protein